MANEQPLEGATMKRCCGIAIYGRCPDCPDRFPKRPGLSRAESDVIGERRRQVEQEGCTAAHDDEHAYREMARAAKGYIDHYTGRAWVFESGNHDDYTAGLPPGCWPWEHKWWKPKTPREDLVRAAALLLAEIDRIDREEKSRG